MSIELVCRWSMDEDGTWTGGCGIVWQFEHAGPVENGVRFCPRCGRLLKCEYTRYEVGPEQ